MTGKTNIGDFQAKVLAEGKYWKMSPHLDAYTDDKSLAGFMGLGTWSQLAVFHSSLLLKLDHEPTTHDAALGSVLATGLLGPSKIVNVDEGSNVAIFGSNSLGLTLLASIRKHKPGMIVVVGAKNDQELFEKFGAHYIVDEEKDNAKIVLKLLEASPDGYDFTFEASDFSRFGSVALEICHKGWGKCALLTRAAEKDTQVSTKPFQLVTGRHWIGSFMGNVNIARDHEKLFEAHKEITEEIAEHIFPADHIVSVDDFPSKWKELSETATYHRTIIKF